MPPPKPFSKGTGNKNLATANWQFDKKSSEELREAHAAGVMELFYYSQFDVISGPLASLLCILFSLRLDMHVQRSRMTPMEK